MLGIGKPLPPPQTGGTMLTKMLGIDPAQMAAAANELMRLAKGYEERLGRIEGTLRLICVKLGVPFDAIGSAHTPGAANGTGGNGADAGLPANGTGGAAPTD